MADADDVNEAAPFWKLPDHMRALVDNVGFIPHVDHEEDEMKIYEQMREGRCMTCRNELEDNTVFLLTRHGIVAAYCCGQCTSDMAILGFLGEQHEDIMTAVKFRGDFPADEAEGKGDD